VVSVDLDQSVGTKKYVKDGASQFDLSCEFPQMSITILYEIITVGLGYHKFCARLVPKMLTGAQKTASAFVVFLE
jgi:hypothetical protein